MGRAAGGDGEGEGGVLLEAALGGDTGAGLGESRRTEAVRGAPSGGVGLRTEIPSSDEATTISSENARSFCSASLASGSESGVYERCNVRGPVNDHDVGP